MLSGLQWFEGRKAEGSTHYQRLKKMYYQRMKDMHYQRLKEYVQPRKSVLEKSSVRASLERRLQHMIL